MKTEAVIKPERERGCAHAKGKNQWKQTFMWTCLKKSKYIQVRNLEHQLVRRARHSLNTVSLLLTDSYKMLRKVTVVT